MKKTGDVYFLSIKGYTIRNRIGSDVARGGFTTDKYEEEKKYL